MLRVLPCGSGRSADALDDLNKVPRLGTRGAFHASLSHDVKLFSDYEQWEATSFGFSLLYFSWPHALTCLPFHNVPETTKFNSSNSWWLGGGWGGGAGGECAQWSMGWSSWEWDGQPHYSFKETHTQAHRALFCVINSGAGSHKVLS